MRTVREIQGKSAMADLVRSKDWAQTELGPIEDWPDLLLEIVNLVLSAPIPMQVYWGRNFISIYNDELMPSLTERHPAALGQPAQTIWREAWPIIGEQLNRIWEQGESESYKRLAIPLSIGSEIINTFCNYSFTPLFDKQGSVCGLLNVAQDVTQSVLTDEALRKSEMELALGMEAASLGMWHYDPKTGILTADERMHRIFGSPEPDGNKDYWLDLLHPEDRERVNRHFVGALAESG